MKMGLIFTGVVVVLSAALLLAVAVDATPTSTAGLAYFFVPLYAAAALVLTWFGVFLATVVRRAAHDWRLANRS